LLATEARLNEVRKERKKITKTEKEGRSTTRMDKGKRKGIVKEVMKEIASSSGRKK
jgi:hypothetical protein